MALDVSSNGTTSPAVLTEGNTSSQPQQQQQQQPQPQTKRPSKFKKFLRGAKAILVAAWPHIRDAIIQYGPDAVFFIIRLFA